MCVDGFVCGWRDENHVPICNFGTREVRFIRCPKEFVNEDYPVCSIGFEPEEQKYKLWLTLHLTDGYTRNWVFTLDLDKSWRQTKCNARFFPTRKRVCFNGVIFMFSYGYRDSLFQIVAFDVKAETFSTFTFSPTLPFNDYIHYNLIEVKGKLGVLNYSSEDLQLWVFGKAQNDDWKRHIIPCPSQWEGIDVKLKSYSSFICSSCDGEIKFESITKSGSYIYICYNITRESWREFEVGTLYVKSEFDGIFCHVENLFPLGKLCNANLQD
ncbi:putative F-box protein At1g55070 [Lycium barbarum]|uniref:putative F-box protein At1g55070 n=1 Tax=Lycium barbarum TaxID=112863 RepID=UPI00293F1568|nr:putative F-box protein At1g55070 [Lycium barbarum]